MFPVSNKVTETSVRSRSLVLHCAVLYAWSPMIIYGLITFIVTLWLSISEPYVLMSNLD